MVHQQFLARIVFQYLDFPPLGPRPPAFMWIQYLDFPWLHPLSQTLPAWHSFNFNILYIYIWLTKSPTTYNNGFPLLFPPTIAARSAKQVRGSKKKTVSKTISFPVKTIPLGPAQTHAGPHIFFTRSKNRTCMSATIFPAPGPKKIQPGPTNHVHVKKQHVPRSKNHPAQNSLAMLEPVWIVYY